MKNIIIACEMLKNELDKIIRTSEKKEISELIYLSSKLHSNPAELNKEIQSRIDSFQECDNILICYGNCGNSMNGIKSPDTGLVLIRAHDCIDLLTKHSSEMTGLRKNTYFFTKSWLDSTGNIINEYEKTCTKYGEKKTKEYYQMILSGYKNVCLIDTGCYDPEKYTKMLEDAGDKFNLKSCQIQGSLKIIEKLVNGNWDDDFIIKKKGETVLLDDYLD